MKKTANELSNIIIGKAIKVHNELGPGLLEAAYRKCLAYELRQAGLFVEEEKPLPLIYREVKIDCGFRLDIFVEKQFVVEIKSIEALAPVHLAQTITYLKLTHTNLGLLLNFNVTRMKKGIKRVVHNF